MQHLPPALAPLGAHRQFITYVIVPSPTRAGKTDKFPTHWQTGAVVSAHDPRNWCSFDEAAASPHAQGPEQGVGYVVSEAAGFWFLDLDNCITPEGAWSDIALQMFQAFPGAAYEVSHSGKGLHFFGWGAAPAHRTKPGKGSYGLGKMEFYTSGRFAALTGFHAGGNAASQHPEALAWLVETCFKPDPNEADNDRDQWPEVPRADWRGPVDDEELIRRAIRSQSASTAFGVGASFADLWTADERALAAVWPDAPRSYDASRADAALAAHLAFWTGCDAPRIERLMRRSALVREKWDRHRTYLRITISGACGRQGEVLHDKPLDLPTAPGVAQLLEAQFAATQPPGVAVTAADLMPTATPRSGSGFISIEDQAAWFNGCVYILDKHKVMVPGGQLLKPDQFKVMYGGASFVMDSGNARVTRNAWECFTESQAIKFPKVEAACFRPELTPFAMVHEEGHSLLNVYRPIDTYRVAGDPEPFLDLMRRILPDPRDVRIVLSYCAALVRNPGRKFQWWPVLQGTQGNGKSAIMRCVAHAVGHRYTHLPNTDDMARNGNKFNSWIENKLFVGIEEIYVSSRRDFLEAFKATVTNDRIPIEGKGIDQVTGDNRANGMMFTNHRDGVPVDVDQRRYSIFFTAQQSKADKVRDGMTGAYFPLLYQWFKGEGAYASLGPLYGYGVVNDFLRTYPIDPEFDPAGLCQEAPQTSSSVQAINESLGGIEQEVMEAVAQGLPGFKGGWISSVKLGQLLDGGKGKGVPHNKRKDMLRGLGYVLHPWLEDGRVSTVVMPDAARPRLFVRADMVEVLAMRETWQIAHAYTTAQA